MLRKTLLTCGIAASALYVATDLLCAIFYPAYHSFFSRAVSELMARGAPTERLVDPLFLLYGALMVAFGVGLWLSDPRRRARVTAALIIVYASSGWLGPTVFEMDVRGARGPTRADLLHIAMTGVMVALIFAIVIAGAALRGRAFRRYSYVSIAVMVVFGLLTSLTMRGLGEGAPTPWLGLFERINIGAYLLWVAVLASSYLRARTAKPLRVHRVASGLEPLPAR